MIRLSYGNTHPYDILCTTYSRVHVLAVHGNCVLYNPDIYLPLSAGEQKPEKALWILFGGALSLYL